MPNLCDNKLQPFRRKKSHSGECRHQLCDARQKTLLIDDDMRKPIQRRLWRTNPTTGLCDFLAKIQDLCIYDVEGIPFSIVCTGTIPPNPSELLSSEGMKNFVEECSKLYEYIIIDTPPIGISHYDIVNFYQARIIKYNVLNLTVFALLCT